VTRVFAAFVGCKVSQADSEAALGRLAAAGLEPVGDAHDADVCLVSTCCVTAEAERKSRRLARRLAQGGRRVFVAGCAATLRAAQFEHPGVEVVAANGWATLAARLAAEERDAAAAPTASSDVARRLNARTRTRFTLKVQEGCAGCCSYCVVRLVRGRPRSTPLAEAVETAAEVLAAGCGEIVLSGIDLGAYRDVTPGVGTAGLPDLVNALVELPGLARLRLSSIEPEHLDERLLDALADRRVARHLHVPLQSADDGVLAAMRRRYTVADYLATVARVRSRLGDVMLSTDVIAGFPTEDDAAFARTLAVIREGWFGRVHVFAYSARPGTEAAALGPLSAAVVRARAAAAGEAAREAQGRAASAALGRRAEVLVEERRDGLWRGYSSQYVRYELKGAARPGQLVSAVADELHGDGVRGRVVATEGAS
jgi:threonylcarbamoyladenosine tRNA methylthiotransferase MtaB